MRRPRAKRKKKAAALGESTVCEEKTIVLVKSSTSFTDKCANARCHSSRLRDVELARRKVSAGAEARPFCSPTATTTQHRAVSNDWSGGTYTATEALVAAACQAVPRTTRTVDECAPGPRGGSQLGPYSQRTTQLRVTSRKHQRERNDAHSNGIKEAKGDLLFCATCHGVQELGRT